MQSTEKYKNLFVTEAEEKIAWSDVDVVQEELAQRKD